MSIIVNFLTNLHKIFSSLMIKWNSSSYCRSSLGNDFKSMTQPGSLLFSQKNFLPKLKSVLSSLLIKTEDPLSAPTLLIYKMLSKYDQQWIIMQLSHCGNYFTAGKYRTRNNHHIVVLNTVSHHLASYTHTHQRHADIHTQTHMHKHTHTDLHAHRHTQTQTHTHSHTLNLQHLGGGGMLRSVLLTMVISSQYPGRFRSGMLQNFQELVFQLLLNV